MTEGDKECETLDKAGKTFDNSERERRQKKVTKNIKEQEKFYTRDAEMEESGEKNDHGTKRHLTQARPRKEELKQNWRLSKAKRKGNARDLEDHFPQEHQWKGDF